MLLIDHPYLLKNIETLHYGYLPLQGSNGQYSLVLKGSKEIILTTNTQNCLRIFLVPDVTCVGRALGFLTVFPDNENEPLFISTPLNAGDDLSQHLASTFSQGEFDLYFLDEHNREWMGVRAQIADVERFRTALSSMSFPPPQSGS